MKKIIYLVILTLSISLAFLFVFGGFVVPKEDYFFEGRYDYLGAVNDKLYYSIGYGTKSIYEFEGGKSTLIYEGTRIEGVKLLTDRIIVFETGSTRILTGFIMERILSINLDSKEIKEIEYSSSLDKRENKIGTQSVVGETDGFIIYSLSERDFVDGDFHYNYYLYFINKEANEVTDKVYLTNVSGTDHPRVDMMIKDNEFAYSSKMVEQYGVYQVSLDDFAINEISLNNSNFIVEWNSQKCVKVLNQQRSKVCEVVDEANVGWMESAITNTSSPIGTYLLLMDDYFVKVIHNSVEIYDLNGALLEEIDFDLEFNNIASFDGELVYLEKTIQNYYFLRTRLRLVSYNPLTGKTKKSKTIEYHPEYIEFDGGV
jgi:hypothetical protein